MRARQCFEPSFAAGNPQSSFRRWWCGLDLRGKKRRLTPIRRESLWTWPGGIGVEHPMRSPTPSASTWNCRYILGHSGTARRCRSCKGSGQNLNRRGRLADIKGLTTWVGYTAFQSLDPTIRATSVRTTGSSSVSNQGLALATRCSATTDGAWARDADDREPDRCRANRRPSRSNSWRRFSRQDAISEHIARRAR